MMQREGNQRSKIYCRWYSVRGRKFKRESLEGKRKTGKQWRDIGRKMLKAPLSVTFPPFCLLCSSRSPPLGSASFVLVFLYSSRFLCFLPPQSIHKSSFDQLLEKQLPATQTPMPKNKGVVSHKAVA